MLLLDPYMTYILPKVKTRLDSNRENRLCLYGNGKLDIDISGNTVDVRLIDLN